MTTIESPAAGTSNGDTRSPPVASARASGSDEAFKRHPLSSAASNNKPDRHTHVAFTTRLPRKMTERIHDPSRS